MRSAITCGRLESISARRTRAWSPNTRKTHASSPRSRTKRFIRSSTPSPPRDATVADLVNAIDYAVKRIGIDHVGISSDFNHGGGIVGWKDESEALNVTTELLRRGYSEDDIAKLWGGNFLRVFRKVETIAHQLRVADSRVR
jgi:membrane dipeptidase